MRQLPSSQLEVLKVLRTSNSVDRKRALEAVTTESGEQALQLDMSSTQSTVTIRDARCGCSKRMICMDPMHLQKQIIW